MKFAVIFEDTGVEEEHEFDTKPVAGDLVTLTRDGVGKDYIVIIERILTTPMTMGLMDTRQRPGSGQHSLR